MDRHSVLILERMRSLLERDFIDEAKLPVEVLDGLRTVFATREVKRELESDVAQAYMALDNAGEGYSIGEEDDEIDELESEAGEFLGTAHSNQLAVYRNKRTKELTIVGDKSGPWAVDVSVK